MADPIQSPIQSPIQGLSSLDLRPTKDRPLFVQTDPKLRDAALQKLAETGVNVGLGVGLAGLGGPASPTILRELGLAGLQTLGGYLTHPQGFDEGVIYPLFHGTRKAFLEHDPSLSGDIGIHFGNLEQATSRTGGGSWYLPGSNIRPSNVDIDNPVRLPDVFSRYDTMRQTADEIINARNTLSVHGYPSEQGVGLDLSGPEKIALREAAEKADSYAFDPTSTRSERQQNFWKTLENIIKSHGHDGIVYANEAEGFGDSYAVFDPKKVTPRFGKIGGLGK
jgi:hypothetical protein